VGYLAFIIIKEIFNLFIVLLPFLIIAGFIAGGIYLYKKLKRKMGKEQDEDEEENNNSS